MWKLCLIEMLCFDGAGEPVADLAGDGRGRGVWGWRLLRNRPKPCVIRMQWKIYFLLYTIFSFFFLSSSCPSLNTSPLVVFIPSNHCYNSFRYMFNQIKPASLPSYCIYAFLSWFSTSDVLQQMVFNTFQSSWVMFFFLTVGNVQETTSTWTWPFITFYIWSVTKCCHNY